LEGKSIVGSRRPTPRDACDRIPSRATRELQPIVPEPRHAAVGSGVCVSEEVSHAARGEAKSGSGGRIPGLRNRRQAARAGVMSQQKSVEDVGSDGIALDLGASTRRGQERRSRPLCLLQRGRVLLIVAPSRTVSRKRRCHRTECLARSAARATPDHAEAEGQSDRARLTRRGSGQPFMRIWPLLLRTNLPLCPNWPRGNTITSLYASDVHTIVVEAYTAIEPEFVRRRGRATRERTRKRAAKLVFKSRGHGFVSCYRTLRLAESSTVHHEGGGRGGGSTPFGCCNPRAYDRPRAACRQR
jgi:hypothetical protein